MNRLILCSLLGAVVAAFPSSAVAQYYPRPAYPTYPNPYANPYNPYYAPGTRYGNALSGAADLTRAQGQSWQDQEQARILREQANQAKLDTRKKAFDQMLYEKANTPTYTEELTKEKVQLLTRLMTFPIRSEITDGKTLNAMLPLLQSLSEQGSMGAPIAIPQSMVNELNISGSGTSSAGMLRGGGQVDWPPALRGPQSKKLDKLLPAAVDAATAGTLDGKMMKQVRTELKTMREDMRSQLQKDEIETSSYLQAIEFYNSLESSVNALERPDTRKQLAGKYSPRARNVQELVDFMTDKGVKFAPASPGNDAAYQVVHDAFVRYARTAQGSSGFQAMNSPMGMKK
jgi:hypothetical protein